MPAFADSPEITPPPSCEATDAHCLIIEENQPTEISGVGAIDFVAIREDSRCPVDVLCFWEGRVQVEFKHAYGTSAEKFVLGIGQQLEDTWVDGRTGVSLVLEQVWPEPNLSNPVEKPYQFKFRVLSVPEEQTPIEEPAPENSPIEEPAPENSPVQEEPLRS